MDVGLRNQDGEIMRHRTMTTRPEMLLQALAPSRAATRGDHLCTAMQSGPATDCARRRDRQGGKKGGNSALRRRGSLDKGSPHTC